VLLLESLSLQSLLCFKEKKIPLIFQTETIKSEFEEKKKWAQRFFVLFRDLYCAKRTNGTSEDVIKKNVVPKPIRPCLLYHHFFLPNNKPSYLKNYNKKYTSLAFFSCKLFPLSDVLIWWRKTRLTTLSIHIYKHIIIIIINGEPSIFLLLFFLLHKLYLALKSLWSFFN